MLNCWPRNLTVYWLIAEQSTFTTGQYSNAVLAAT